MTPALAAMLPDGRRLHLQHGPIDLVVEAFGAPDQVAAAYRQAAARFETILGELVAELPLLRRPLDPDGPSLQSQTAKRMAWAIIPHAETFITPMAAVAGAVADEILAALKQDRDLDRAYVNNGGDIALHLGPGQQFEIGLIARTGAPQATGKALVRAEDPVRGIATSGADGRSLSLGIADAVTVLASDAARADAAATLIANAVDPGPHPAIRRQAALEIDLDSDLGDRLVTVAVGDLDHATIAKALDHGEAVARAMLDQGLIAATALRLKGQTRAVGNFDREAGCSKAAIGDTLASKQREILAHARH